MIRRCLFSIFLNVIVFNSGIDGGEVFKSILKCGFNKAILNIKFFFLVSGFSAFYLSFSCWMEFLN